jgi:hypothetical protein
LNCIDLSKALTYCNAKCALSIASGLFSDKLKGSGVTSAKWDRTTGKHFWSYHEHLKKKELAKSIQPFSSDALTNEHHFIFIISRVQMKSWAGKALETVNCCAFLKRSSWSMLTANLKLRAKKFFLFFLSLQYFTLKIE